MVTVRVDRLQPIYLKCPSRHHLFLQYNVDPGKIIGSKLSLRKGEKMRFDVETGQTLIHLHIEKEDKKHIQAICDNKTYTLDYVKMKGDHLLLRLNGHNYDILINKEENNWKMNVNGKPVELTIYDARMRKLKALSKSDRNPKSSKEIKAPMPGLVLHVHVKEGDEVKANDGLLVIEAMKMENEIRAVSNGVVKKMNIKEGQAVDKGSLLLQLE